VQTQTQYEPIEATAKETTYSPSATWKKSPSGERDHDVKKGRSGGPGATWTIVVRKRIY